MLKGYRFVECLSSCSLWRNASNHDLIKYMIKTNEHTTCLPYMQIYYMYEGVKPIAVWCKSRFHKNRLGTRVKKLIY